MKSEFTVAGVLDASFGTFFRNFPALVGLGLLVHLPFHLAIFAGALKAESGDPSWMTNVTWLGSFLLFGIMLLVLQGAVAYGVYEDLNNRSFPFGKSLGVALRRLLPVLLVSILSTVLSGVAALLLIIPGIMVYCALWVAVPVTVVERRGIVDSLRRSGDLTVGFRLKIFLLTLVFVILNWLITFVLSAIMGSIYASVNQVHPIIYVFSYAIISAITGALGAVLTAVGYFRLRIDVEGVDLQDLVSVFD